MACLVCLGTTTYAQTGPGNVHNPQVEAEWPRGRAPQPDTDDPAQRVRYENIPRQRAKYEERARKAEGKEHKRAQAKPTKIIHVDKSTFLSTFLSRHGINIDWMKDEAYGKIKNAASHMNYTVYNPETGQNETYVTDYSWSDHQWGWFKWFAQKLWSGANTDHGVKIVGQFMSQWDKQKAREAESNAKPDHEKEARVHEMAREDSRWSGKNHEALHEQYDSGIDMSNYEPPKDDPELHVRTEEARAQYRRERRERSRERRAKRAQQGGEK